MCLWETGIPSPLAHICAGCLQSKWVPATEGAVIAAVELEAPTMSNVVLFTAKVVFIVIVRCIQYVGVARNSYRNFSKRKNYICFSTQLT
jgi:hypothetical protein